MSSIASAEWRRDRDSGKIPPQMAAPLPDDSLESIAERLKLVRKALGLKQVAIAARLGADVTPQKWNNWERARDRIPVDIATRLWQATGASLDYVYIGVRNNLPAALDAKIHDIEQKAAPAQKRARRA